MRAVLFVLLGGFLACTGLSGCSSLFYFPTQDKYYDPAQMNLTYEDFWLQTQSGSQIHGWKIPGQKPSRGSVVFFHGNAENLTSHFTVLAWLPPQGYDLFIFDYPQYGLSKGDLSPSTTVEAGVAVLEWVHEKYKPQNLIVYGHSLGGTVALKSVEEVKASIPIAKVVIQSSFGSYRGMSQGVLKRQWWTWPVVPITYLFISRSHDPKVEKLSPIPLLFIHGTGDRVVESYHSEELFAQAGEPKELWLIPQGNHMNLYGDSQNPLRERLLDFLSRD